MDFDRVIASHAEWELKFQSAVRKNEKVDAAAIGMDNRIANAILSGATSMMYYRNQ